MNGKRNLAKRSSLVGTKWLLTTLAVASTLGLWQVFAGAEADERGLKAGSEAVQPAAENGLARVEAGVPAGFEQFPSDVAIKIILPGAQAPGPLAVTRSS